MRPRCGLDAKVSMAIISLSGESALERAGRPVFAAWKPPTEPAVWGSRLTTTRPPCSSALLNVRNEYQPSPFWSKAIAGSLVESKVWTTRDPTFRVLGDLGPPVAARPPTAVGRRVRP